MILIISFEASVFSAFAEISSTKNEEIFELTLLVEQQLEAKSKRQTDFSGFLQHFLPLCEQDFLVSALKNAMDLIFSSQKCTEKRPMTAVISSKKAKNSVKVLFIFVIFFKIDDFIN